MKRPPSRHKFRTLGQAERFEACLVGASFSPHRHDTYTLGLTLSGVQCFDYRGTTRHALPGDAVVLHPDELHDGRPGTDVGFRYRAINLPACVVQACLGGRSLPFIAGGVTRDPGLKAMLAECLGDDTSAPGKDESEEMVLDLVEALDKAAGQPNEAPAPDRHAAQTARDMIEDRVVEGVSLNELSRITGTDRFSLNRSFRALYGTSPHRYLVQRRIDHACALIAEGEACAQAALMSGFSDQSHFLRHFRKTHGMTPRRWIALRTNIQ